jgi:large subunit ribosomal protein L3
MITGILGRKVGMTQIYNDKGQVIPVTVVAAGPCDVLQVRTAQLDGYEAVQLGYLDKPRRLASRSQRGHVAKLDSKRAKSLAQAGVEAIPKANCEPKRYIREIRGAAGDLAVGAKVDLSIFNDVKAVDVTGTSKGRGFSGAMKRHNFSGQRATHGVKKCHRHLGGLSSSAFPSRIFKGKKMPGHYGAAKSTMRNLKVVRIDLENNLILLRGAVPGPNGGYVTIRTSNKL